MSHPESSLPDAWVRKIWDTMRSTYGAAFDRQWECPVGTTPEAHVQNLMAVWGRGLAQLQQNPQAIAYGLDNLPEDFPPNLLQFRAICNRRPDPKLPALEAPRAAPEKVREMVSKLIKTPGETDLLDWARALHAADQKDGTFNGRPITLAQRQTYKQALRLN